MALAALVISILSFAAAAGSAIYARSQAIYTRAMARNDAARRLEERTPKIEMKVESVNDGNWYRLWLRLLERGPLTDATVEILDPPYVQFTMGTDGVDRDPSLRNRVGHTGPVLIGGDFAWRVEWDSRAEHPLGLRLKITLRGSEPGETWFMTKVVEVPPAPPDAGFLTL